MKIRIRGNSIRLRLERDEVSGLDPVGSVSEALTLSPDIDFIYVCRTGDVSAIKVEPLDMGIAVVLPKAWTRGWSKDDRVGFEGEVETAPGEMVRVVVEKDFKCLTERPNEDDSGAYPHPDKTHCPSTTSE